MKNGEIVVEIKADMEKFNAAIKKATKAAKALRSALAPKWWQFWLWFRPIKIYVTSEPEQLTSRDEANMHPTISIIESNETNRT